MCTIHYLCFKEGEKSKTICDNNSFFHIHNARRASVMLYIYIHTYEHIRIYGTSYDSLSNTIIDRYIDGTIRTTGT